MPLTFQADLLTRCRNLTGLSIEASVAHGKTNFAEGFLFTHRGISGPSILQISSYWREGDEIVVDLAPGETHSKPSRASCTPQARCRHRPVRLVPKRLAQDICEHAGVSGRLADAPDKALAALAAEVNQWRVKPAGSEGYKTAEVTLGGVDTTQISSKTMESTLHKGLYFIGEVSRRHRAPWGFNFQWAWASGFVAGQSV